MADTSKVRAIRARERRKTILTILKRIGGWATDTELQRYTEGAIRPLREDLKALGKKKEIELISAKHWNEAEDTSQTILVARAP